MISAAGLRGGSRRLDLRLRGKIPVKETWLLRTHFLNEEKFRKRLGFVIIALMLLIVESYCK